MKDITEKLFAKSNGESIKAHSKKVIDAYIYKATHRQCGENNAKLIAKANIIMPYSAQYHDIAKGSVVFQEKVGNLEYIKSLGPEGQKELLELKSILGTYNDNHEEISVLFVPPSLINEIGETNFKILLMSINGHHSRLKERRLSDAQKIAIAKSIERLTGLKAYPRNLLILKDAIENYDNFSKDEQALYIFVAGELQACDGYASDTNIDKAPIVMDIAHDGKYMCDYIEEAFSEKGYKLNKLQEYCREKRNKSVIITASAGLGKTEAALEWVGEQACIYTLPMQTSSNAMEARLKKETKYPAEKIALLHSNSLSIILDEDFSDHNIKNALIEHQAARLFSHAFTITTIDQVLPFVYKYRGGERLLANFANMKIVIDELQSYEPEIVAKVCLSLKQIQDMGGKFLIITATMPPIFIEAMRECGLEFDAPEPFLMDINRHYISYKEEEIDFNYIKEMAAQGKKVLVICNTVKKAVNTYKTIKAAGISNVKCLHKNYCKAHRAKIEDYVVNFAKSDNKEAGVFVSTQITEASLDIDFDVIITELCGAANIVQRLARCYRRREHDTEGPNVHIYNTGNGINTIYDKIIFELTANYFRRNNNKLFTEEAKMELIKEVYSSEALKDSEFFSRFRKELNRLRNIPFDLYSKKDAKKFFRDIAESITAIPVSVYNKNIDKIEVAIEKMSSKNFKDRLQGQQIIDKYTISINTQYDAKRARDCRKIKDDLHYYLIDYDYDFDEETLSGYGLGYDNKTEDNVI